MDQNFLQNALSITLFCVCVFVAIRAFTLYFQLRSTRLFILGISMTMVALTAGAGFAGDNLTTVSLNVDWFNYIGQTVSFAFILASLLRSNERYLRAVVRWQLLFCIPLLALLLLSTVLPPEFPNPGVTKTILSGSRGLISLCIFYYYVSAFMRKETRFSLLMGAAFLLISLGYFIIIPKYGGSDIINADLLDQIGDYTRLSGLLTLLIAVLAG